MTVQVKKLLHSFENLSQDDQWEFAFVILRRTLRFDFPPEVWLVDLGLAAKVRPCLVLSVAPQADERALCTLVAHTTSERGTQFEVAAHTRFLRRGAFDAQNIITLPNAKLST